MKKAKDLHKVLDNAIDHINDESIDHRRGNAISKLCSNKISLALREIQYKNLTGRPDKVEFFED